MNTTTLRDSPDAKLRLLELVLQAEPHRAKPRDQWPDIILAGNAFAPEETQ